MFFFLVVGISWMRSDGGLGRGFYVRWMIGWIVGVCGFSFEMNVSFFSLGVVVRVMSLVLADFSCHPLLLSRFCVGILDCIVVAFL